MKRARISEARPFASLSPTLLARKGGARPAMRPQSQALTSFERQTLQEQEDLGWNDMGETAEGEIPEAAILPLSVAEGEVTAPALPDFENYEKPAVRLQQEDIARKVASRNFVKSERKRKSALDGGRRAAFTLRLDAERHLRLRLACTIRNLSAQQIVTEALDRLLAEMPELEALAAQVKRK